MPRRAAPLSALSPNPSLRPLGRRFAAAAAISPRSTPAVAVSHHSIPYLSVPFLVQFTVTSWYLQVVVAANSFLTLWCSPFATPHRYLWTSPLPNLNLSEVKMLPP
jgi:hypothetical protein